MEGLKKKRKALRISFTMCCNAIEETLKTSPATKDQLNALKNQLMDKFSRLDLTQIDISQALLDDDEKEQEYADDFKQAETYRDKYFEFLSSLDTALQKNMNNAVNADKRRFRLPKLELRKFDGDPKQYSAFWSQFEKIHTDVDIVEEDKFQYLIQCTVPGSKVEKLVNSYPPIKENYEKVIKQIKERYGRDDLLVQVYVRDLLSTVMENATGRLKNDLSELYDHLETKLMALESIGRTQDKFADFLEPLVESCLPEHVLRAWERNRANEETLTQDSARSLKKLMTFLKNEVQGEEIIKLARAGLGVQRNNHPTNHPKPSENIHVSTIADLLNTHPNESTENINSCLFCDKKHCTYKCFYAKRLSLEDRRKIIKEKHACYKCLRVGHLIKDCKSKVTCSQCGKHHYAIMCPNQEKEILDKKTEGPINDNVLANCDNINNTVYLQTIILNIRNGDRKLEVRAIIDGGSQQSYISEKVVQVLKLVPKNKQNVVHSLFGGRTTQPRRHSVFNIEACDIDNNYSCMIKVLSENKICGSVPKMNDILTLSELKKRNILIRDINSKEYDVNMLIGADVISTILTGNMFTLESGLMVIETKFGNTIMGKVEKVCELPRELTLLNTSNNYSRDNVFISLHCADFSVSDLWNIETINIKDPIENSKRNMEFSEVTEHFNTNLKILLNRRYELKLPFKGSTRPICNKNMVFRRNLRMCSRAENDSYIHPYVEVSKQWENLGIIEKVPRTEESDKCYLPHRPAIKTACLTTKIRPVFDASARCGNYASLNDCLIKGPNMIEMIPDLLDRFRLHLIGLSPDIEKVYLQLSIEPEQRDYLRFFHQFKYRHKLLNDLKYRFRKEYLGLLVQNKNDKSASILPQLEEIVLIGDDTKKRMNWPLAKVTELITGGDGKVRVVKLKTSTGTILRPIQRIYPPEIHSENDCSVASTQKILLSMITNLYSSESNSTPLTVDENFYPRF